MSDTVTRRRLLVRAGALVATLPLVRGIAGCEASEPETQPQMQPGGGGAPQAQTAAPSAPPAEAPGAPTGGAETRLVTEVPAMQAMVQSLQYVAQSPKPDQRCDNCFFYTAVAEGRGRCQLFPQGQVTAGAWCSSWRERQPAG